MWPEIRRPFLLRHVHTSTKVAATTCWVAWWLDVLHCASLCGALALRATNQGTTNQGNKRTVAGLLARTLSVLRAHSSPLSALAITITTTEDDDAATLHHTCILKFYYLLVLGFG